MAELMTEKHTCFRCVPHAGEIPRRKGAEEEPAALESVEATFSESGEEVFLASGYSAREIAQAHARETGGKIYVNNVSRRIKRPDLTKPVSYAVASAPVYTLRGADRWHEGIYRAYWRPLE